MAGPRRHPTRAAVPPPRGPAAAAARAGNGAAGPAREVIRTTDSSRDLVDKKMAVDGMDAFESASLPDFLAESGRHLDRAGLAGVVRKLANADARRYLPAISSALAGLAEDSGEFAGLVGLVDGRTRGSPAREQFAGALASLAAAKPGLAAGLARRLIQLGAAYPAAFLAGGAWRDDPAGCAAIAVSLARSDSGEAAAAGIVAMRVALKMHGIADASAWIGALSRAASRHGGAVAAEAVDVDADALADIYPAASGEAGPLIEGLIRGHAACRSRLAARIQFRSPFGDDAARRYLAVCAGGDPDPLNPGGVHVATAELAKRDPGAAIRIVAGRVFEMHPDANLGYALQEIGRVNPGGLVEAVLAEAGACRSPYRDAALDNITMDIARHAADPEAILDPLFGALDRGGEDAAYLPALRMIRAMVTRNRDTARDDVLAMKTLRRLVRHARTRGIDAERLAKKEHDADLKCAAIVDRLLHPLPAVDAGRTLQNLDAFPALKKAFGVEWVRAAATAGGRAPHPLVIALSILRPGKVGRPPAGPSGREPCPSDVPAPLDGPAPSPPLFVPRREEIALECLAFLDGTLALLEAAGPWVAGYAKKLKNPDQFPDAISEIAIVAAFAGEYRVEPEPSVAEKRLDAAIEIGPQRVLVEVLGPHMWGPLDLLAGGRGVPRGRVAGKIFDKVKEQIPATGTCNDPVVVAVDSSRSEVEWCDIESYVLGPAVHTAEVDRETGKKVASASYRDSEKCMHRLDSRTDSISAIICFKPGMSAGPAAAARGVVIENPHAAVPLDPKARDAIAGILRGAPPGGGCRRRGAVSRLATPQPAGALPPWPVQAPAPRHRTAATRASCPRVFHPASPTCPASNCLNGTGRPCPLIAALHSVPPPRRQPHAPPPLHTPRPSGRIPARPRSGLQGQFPLRTPRRTPRARGPAAWCPGPAGRARAHRRPGTVARAAAPRRWRRSL